MTEDLAPERVRSALPDRSVRAYPALLSTEAEAMAWARSGAPHGAVVVADYQVSPRGRAGVPLVSRLGEGLGFSVVLRPEVSVEREGWPYLVGSLAVADVLGRRAADEVLAGTAGGEQPRLVWPDKVTTPKQEHLAHLGLYVQLGPHRVEWEVLTVLVTSVEPPRTELLAELVQAVDTRLREPAEQVLEAYRARCASLGRMLRALLIPVGPSGPQVTGTAVDVLEDGALVLLTSKGNRVAVRPTNLGVLEDAG